MAFNKRKAGQSLKDFKQDIIKDMNRYSSIPAKITVGNNQVDNPEKERQEVKRFKAGLRDPEGKKDRAYRKNMRYHLQEDADHTWKLAMYYACRWEGADSDVSNSDDSTDTPESEDDVKAVEVKSADVRSKKKQKKTKTKCSQEDGIIASLTDKVQENQIKIKQIETTQERTSTQLKEVKDTLDTYNGSLQSIEAKLDAAFAQPSKINQSYAYSQPGKSNQPYAYAQPQQPSRTLWRPQQRFNQQGKANFRPQNNTWSGNMQHPKQGNYGFQRKTPNSFPVANQGQIAPPNAPAPSTAPTSTNAVAPTNTVAAMEETEMTAEPLLAFDDQDPGVVLPYSDYVHLTGQAGFDSNGIELAAVSAIENLNFQ